MAIDSSTWTGRKFTDNFFIGVRWLGFISIGFDYYYHGRSLRIGFWPRWKPSLGEQRFKFNYCSYGQSMKEFMDL